MRNRNLVHWITVLILAAIVLGCRTLLPQRVPATISPRATAATPETVQPSPEPPTPAPSHTPAPCPPRSDVAAPQRPVDFDDYTETLRAYLAAGGDPASLPAILNAWEADGTLGERFLQADINHDGIQDTVIAFVDPASEIYPPAGTLAIFTCRDGSVRTLYTYNPGEWFALNVIGAADMTQDTLTDLIFADVSCGAHTCWHTLHVWSWQDVDFQEHIGDEFSFPYPSFTLEDGHILAGGGGIGSVGAGPQRPMTTTLAWDGDVITATATTLGPAIYRVHVFRDGDEALFAGDYAHAMDAYIRTLNDTSLEAWGGYTSIEEENRWFAALAHWRLILVEIHNPDGLPYAQEYYTELQNDSAPGEAGYALVPIGEHFWTRFVEDNNIVAACAEAIKQPETQDVLDFLNGFGYANPTYTLDDLCPFFSE